MFSQLGLCALIAASSVSHRTRCCIRAKASRAGIGPQTAGCDTRTANLAQGTAPFSRASFLAEGRTKRPGWVSRLRKASLPG